MPSQNKLPHKPMQCWIKKPALVKFQLG